MKQKQKTLLILTPGFPASEEDSTCLPLQQALTRGLKKEFPWLNLVVISFQYPYHNKIYTCAGATVHSFGNKNRGHLFKYILRKKILQKLDFIHQNEEIIGLISFWYGECAAVGNLFALKHSIRHVCWLLGQDARPGNKHVKEVRLDAEQLIAVSDSIRSEFYNNYGRMPFRTIIPGLNLEHFRFPIQEKDIDILGVGSLIPLKQFDVFLEMIAEIKTRFPNLRCCLVGEGPERKKLQEMIISLNLESTVSLLGELPYTEIMNCMSKSKMLLHTSSYEGFSGVCMEALASGAQVLSFVQPMKYPIPNWHIANDKIEMLSKLQMLLLTNNHSPVQDFPIEKTAGQFMELFIQEPYALEKLWQLSLTE